MNNLDFICEERISLTLSFSHFPFFPSKSFNLKCSYFLALVSLGVTYKGCIFQVVIWPSESTGRAL